jgi:hypothetical protein
MGMAREQVFYSLHFDNDVFRVQQVRQMGVIDGNKPVSENDWEQLRRTGDSAVKRWIDDNMKYTRCVIVLIGSETSTRPWVNHEISKAWEDGRGLLGVYIHNFRCPRYGICGKGLNPFDNFTVGGQRMSALVDCYDPVSYDAYGDVARNLPLWVAGAIARSRNK